VPDNNAELPAVEDSELLLLKSLAFSISVISYFLIKRAIEEDFSVRADKILEFSDTETGDLNLTTNSLIDLSCIFTGVCPSLNIPIAMPGKTRINNKAHASPRLVIVGKPIHSTFAQV